MEVNQCILCKNTPIKDSLFIKCSNKGCALCETLFKPEEWETITRPAPSGNVVWPKMELHKHDSIPGYHTDDGNCSLCVKNKTILACQKASQSAGKGLEPFDDVKARQIIADLQLDEEAEKALGKQYAVDCLKIQIAYILHQEFGAAPMLTVEEIMAVIEAHEFHGEPYSGEDATYPVNICENNKKKLVNSIFAAQRERMG